MTTWKDKFEQIGLLELETLTIFQCLRANSLEEVSFEKVKVDRLELDKIVLRDILGLSEIEHLEVYKAVVDLVKSCLEKAKSVGEKGKKNGGSLSGAVASFDEEEEDTEEEFDEELEEEYA